MHAREAKYKSESTLIEKHTYRTNTASQIQFTAVKLPKLQQHAEFNHYQAS